jgi:prepilin peptidase CpaA
VEPGWALSMLAVSILTLLAMAAVSDWRSRTIPDFIPIAIITLLFLAIAAFPDLRADAVSRLLALLIMVVAGTVLGATGILGGGDIKLLAALAPWHGLTGLPIVLLLIGVAGGILAMGFVVRSALAGEGWRAGLKVRVPYALAILTGETALVLSQIA